MIKTKIDWCDSTWNPVTGCLHGCEYCYARKMANRFSTADKCHTFTDGQPYLHINGVKLHELDNQAEICKSFGKDIHGFVKPKFRKAPYPFGFEPTFHKYRLNDYIDKKGRNIFVCSMADLFGNWVPDSWIEEVFKACEKAPQHNYLFLTKNVLRYAEYGVPSGENKWYGISITNRYDIESFYNLPAFRNTFVSIEPLLEDLKIEKCTTMFRQVDWFIIGAETGRRKNKVVPKRKWIEEIVNECKIYNRPIFMKSSLADIWGEPLIQEFPKELRK